MQPTTKWPLDTMFYQPSKVVQLNNAATNKVDMDRLVIGVVGQWGGESLSDTIHRLLTIRCATYSVGSPLW